MVWKAIHLYVAVSWLFLCASECMAYQTRAFWYSFLSDSAGIVCSSGIFAELADKKALDN